jgi:hypothetical protein
VGHDDVPFGLGLVPSEEIAKERGLEWGEGDFFRPDKKHRPAEELDVEAAFFRVDTHDYLVAEHFVWVTGTSGSAKEKRAPPPDQGKQDNGICWLIISNPLD